MMPELDAEYYKKQADQDAKLEKLITTVDHQKDSVDDLDDRMRSLEKQVWGAGAVLAVLFGGIGIVSQMEGVNMFPVGEHEHEIDRKHLVESEVYNKLFNNK
tara:strand:- start:1213 stop:1518 length:306 start_codon:yes stop_codon:yes gene_type:complete